MKTPKEIAALFNCTEERARELLQANAKELGGMASKAALRGKKVNGYTQAQLQERADACAKAASR